MIFLEEKGEEQSYLYRAKAHKLTGEDSGQLPYHIIYVTENGTKNRMYCSYFPLAFFGG